MLEICLNVWLKKRSTENVKRQKLYNIIQKSQQQRKRIKFSDPTNDNNEYVLLAVIHIFKTSTISSRISEPSTELEIQRELDI